jgi:hypothetical protein
MNMTARVVTAVVLATALSCSFVFGQASTTPVSPFDKDDPEIALIRSLDWKSANFDALDTMNKCLALMALNTGLTNMAAKADTRVDLLVDYLDQNNLGQAYASAKGTIPPPQNVTFEMMEKLAAAYAQTPAGQAKLANQLTGSSPEMLNMYLGLYDKSARRMFEETREARWEVRSMGLFLEQQGKLDDFKTWAIAEQKRRDDDLKRQEAEQLAKEQQERQQRAQAYAQQQQQEQEAQQRAAQQMDMAMQQQQQSSGDSSGSTVENDSYWGDPYGWYGGYYGYYTSNAYRGYVRDKAQDAYQRWRQNNPQRPSQLPAQRPALNRGAGGGYRGGGGFRGGGRR